MTAASWPEGLLPFGFAESLDRAPAIPQKVAPKKFANLTPAWDGTDFEGSPIQEHVST